jgi:hypothetical protein
MPFYDSRKMVEALRAEGRLVNRKRVRRLMRLMGLVALAWHEQRRGGFGHAGLDAKGLATAEGLISSMASPTTEPQREARRLNGRRDDRSSRMLAQERAIP